MTLNTIFDRLWVDYIMQNPSAGKIHDLFINEGESVVNDHIAFRTLDFPEIDMDVLAWPFVSKGYVAKGEYNFKEKHLFAKHFELDEVDLAPRIFISQLSEESEYAAWFYVFGFRANHFTVSINALKKYNDIHRVNDLLTKNGFVLNTSGGEIKGTPADLVQQSSTLADSVNVKFIEGSFEVPCCYYEFAQRFPDSEGHLYNGFVAKSADRIFESTDFNRKK